MEYDVILLTNTQYLRAIGVYRLRTELEKHNYKVKIIDFMNNFSILQLKVIFKKYCSKQTKIIGISSTFYKPETIINYDISKWIKSLWPDIKLVVGGANTLKTNESYIDYKITGYADQSIIALLEYLDGITNIQFKTIDHDPYHTPIIDSNENFGNINIDSVNTIWKKEDQIRSCEALPIEISRGCIFKCAFCAYPLNGKKKFDYIRTVDNLVEEFQYNYEAFGVKHYAFMDDTYNDSDFKLNLIDSVLNQLDFKITYVSYIKPELLVNWPHHIPQLIEQGFQGSTMGIESFHPEARMSIHKSRNIDKLLESITELSKNSRNQFSMIAGLPHEPVDSMIKSFHWVLTHQETVARLRAPAMAIFHPDYTFESTNSKSLIDLDPKKYGYDIDVNDKTYWPYANWKNKFTTYEDMLELSKSTQKESNKVSLIASWQISRLRFHEMDYDITNNTREIDYYDEINRQEKRISYEYYKKLF